jgi:pimeloyl-ACP methyl ester carboxylesterase
MTAQWNWSGAIPTFAERYHVIAPDSPGHGQSANPRAELRYDAMAQDMLALADRLHLSCPAIYGFSDGAQIALEIAIQAPERPSAIVLAAVLHELTWRYRANMRAFVGAPSFAEPAFSATQPALAAECRTRHSAWDELAPQVWELWMRPLDLPPSRLARIAAPTLLLTGDRDPFVALEQTVALMRLLPASELAVIPAAGHACDERFTRAALGFLDRHVPSDPSPGSAGSLSSGTVSSSNTALTSRRPPSAAT